MHNPGLRRQIKNVRKRVELGGLESHLEMLHIVCYIECLEICRVALVFLTDTICSHLMLTVLTLSIVLYSVSHQLESLHDGQLLVVSSCCHY